MNVSYLFLQHYWWFVISLLCGILVFLLFVQGGQTLLYRIARTDEQRSLLISSLGLKWELTFTTLVTFGGAFFASFPLFYSTSFGGAFYVWMAILFFFVIQAVSYEYRSKPANFLGKRTYSAFLFLNGLFGTILLGAALGTFFTGANFTVSLTNLGNDLGGFNTISTWANPWRGLEAVLNYRNVALGLTVFFLARVLAIEYFYNNVDNADIVRQSRRPLKVSAALFLVFFLVFFISLLFSPGWAEDPATGNITVVSYKYLENMADLPLVTTLFLLGVLSVLYSMYLAIFRVSRKAIWFGGAGTVLTVTMLLLLAGYNHTAYYPSLVDPNSSLTITNSSSSPFTLRVMMYASFFIPLIVAYIWYTWRSMSKKPFTDKSPRSGEIKY